MKGRVIIRRSKAGEFRAIKELIGLYPSKLIQKHLPKLKEFYIAEFQGRIIGCCALEVYSRRLAEIRSLVVRPEFQKQGIGNSLVKRCLKAAKAKRIYEILSVTSSTKMFKRLGFRTFNREKYAMLMFL